MLGGTAVGISKPHKWKLPHIVHHTMNSCTILTYIHADCPVWNMYILYTNSQGTTTSVDAQSLCPTGFIAKTLKVPVPPLVRLTFSWSRPASATGVEWMRAGNTRCHHRSSLGLAILYVRQLTNSDK